MSYILEALKKAQAERQLGALPTIHAPQLQGRDDAAGTRFKKPFWLATGLTALVLMTLLLWWRQPWQGSVPAAPVQTPSTAPVAVVPPSVVPPSVVPLAVTVVPPSVVALPVTVVPPSVVALPVTVVPPSVAALPVTVVPPSVVALPVTVVPPSVVALPVTVVPPSVVALPVTVVPHPVMPPPVVAVKPATVVAPGAQPLTAPRAAATPPLPARAAAPALPVAPPPALAVASVVTEDPVLSLRELPEPIQRQIVPLAIGGYIYSKNPADRLLLVDKVLRHEGEEVGPGLTLEKLQPKSAVFNFKGYRYRVPY